MSEPLFDEIAGRHPAVAPDLEAYQALPAVIPARPDGWCENRPSHELTDYDGVE